jgi:hypothetical protein
VFESVAARIREGMRLEWLCRVALPAGNAEQMLEYPLDAPRCKRMYRIEA